MWKLPSLSVSSANTESHLLGFKIMGMALLVLIPNLFDGKVSRKATREWQTLEIIKAF